MRQWIWHRLVIFVWFIVKQRERKRNQTGSKPLVRCFAPNVCIHLNFSLTCGFRSRISGSGLLWAMLCVWLCVCDGIWQPKTHKYQCARSQFTHFFIIIIRVQTMLAYEKFNLLLLTKQKVVNTKNMPANHNYHKNHHHIYELSHLLQFPNPECGSIS